MPIDIVMPKLSDTMEEGKLLKWYKGQGDRVEKGEKFFEVETDKADMEVEAFDSGTLSKILLQEGRTARVGSTIALMQSDEETAKTEEEMPVAAPAEPPAPEPAPAEPRAAAAPEEAAKAAASPLARRIAEQLGIDLSEIRGTGPEGRITKEDVEAAARSREAVPDKAGPPAAEELVGGTGLEDLSPMRRAIAKTVVKSKTEIPHFYVTVEADVTDMVKVKKSLEKSDQFAGRHLTYSHLIIKATVLSLKKHPLLNAYFRDGKIQRNRNINIGVVVAVEGGLLIPVIKNCEDLTLSDIADRENELVQKARSGRLKAGDLSGGTFSISNAGILDVDEFAAIIHPPQSAILAVASIADKPKVQDQQVIAAKMVKMTISVDHRTLDGIVAARFLDDCKFFLENPGHLVL